MSRPTLNTSAGQPIRLSDQWAFSSETSLRIPDLLRDIRTRLRWHDLKVLGKLTDEPLIKIDFTRRLLSGPGRDVPERAYQFTYSDRFEKFRGLNRDDWRVLKRTAQKARTFFENNAKHKEAWDVTLRLFKLEYNDTSDQAMAAEMALLAPDSFPLANTQQARAKTFQSLTLLYKLYSRIPFVGFLTSVLDDRHFGDEVSRGLGCPRALGYLLQVDSALTSSGERAEPGTALSPGGRLPPVVALWRIDSSGVAQNLMPNSPNERVIEQPHGKYFPYSSGVAEHSSAGLQQLHTELWRIFNEYHHPEHLLAIPVYDADNLGSGQSPSGKEDLV